MFQRKTILLSLALLAFLLCFQANASFLPSAYSLRKPVLKTHASSSGIVELKKETSSSGTFYAEADLAYYDPSNSTSRSNSADAPTTVKMMISIPNTESMVATMGCFNFSNYDCSKYNCRQFINRTKHIDYPSFSADGYESRSDMCLDYNHWSFADSTDYLYTAYACQSNDVLIGSNRYGVLGLGTGPRSKYQFRSSKTFSIYIKPALSSGKLVFKKDAGTYAQSPEPLFEFYANNTWRLPIIDGSIKVGDHAIDIKGNVAFDINSDAIGLPSKIFGVFMNYVRNTFRVYCDDSVYRPVCQLTQSYQNLSNITLVYNGQNIVIPPKIYATPTQEGSSSFYLNFRATHPYDLLGKSYVTPTFQNSIILDANFMSYYYTVFDFSTGINYVSLYHAKHEHGGASEFFVF